MSSPLFKTDIKFIQRMLSCAGLYTDKIDGIFSDKTTKAEAVFDKLTADYAKQYGAFDARSEEVIATLLPKAQIVARQFMRLAGSNFKGGEVKLLSGTRTYAEQAVLFAQGRTAKGKIVTNANAGQSNHNFGIAWDVGIFVSGNYLTGKNNAEVQVYKNLAALVMPTFKDRLGWGGAWTGSLKDNPHYEMLTNKTITQVRTLFEAGKPYV